MNEIYYEQVQYSEPGLHGDFAMVVCYDLTGVKSETVPHWHKAVEVTLPLENPLLVTADGEMWEAPEGKVLLINSRSVHVTKGKDKARPSRGCVLLLSEEAFTGFCPEFERLRFNLSPDSPVQPELVKAMKALYDCKTHPSPFIQAEVNALICHICYLLLSRTAVPRDGTDPPEQRPDSLARKAVEYIEANYKSALTLSQVADWVGLQENYFCRYFRKYTGTSFGKYLSQVRLKFALAYMVEFGASVTDSALQAGFASSKAFTDCCRRVYGMTPAEYKKMIFRRQTPDISGHPVMRDPMGKNETGDT